MRVVSDTSAISNLAIIHRLDLLQKRYREIRIPPAVASELDRLSHLKAAARISSARKEGWIMVESVGTQLAHLPITLDEGEAAAIALASNIKADLLLMDEKKGRAAARHLGIPVSGI